MQSHSNQVDVNPSAIKHITVTVLPDGRLSNKDAAKYIGVSVSTLANMRQRKYGPDFTKVCGRIFYYQNALDQFLHLSWYAINNPTADGALQRQYWLHCQHDRSIDDVDANGYPF